jgi:hypothetical protein
MLVSYEGETWSFRLREEHRLKAENMVLRKIFCHKRKKVTADWRKLANRGASLFVQIP